MPVRKLWDPKEMEAAVLAVLRREMGYLKAAKHFQVPLTTVKRFVTTARQQEIPFDKIGEMIRVPLGRKPILLSHELEDELVKYCIEMDKTFFGLRRGDVCRMAYELAVNNNLKHPFSLHSKKAGKKWLRKFLLRHPELSFRKPQSISVARVKSFTRENVSCFFNILKPKLEMVKFQPQKVFNCDETGITVVQHKPGEVLSVRGKREVHKLSSAERGRLITIIPCMSASGQFIPPMIIFPKKNKKAEYGEGAPPGSLIEYNPSGWISTTLFTKWFRHFISYVNATKEAPVILVFDGHFSHTRNLELINLARENHIILICLPPHCSAKMQPLDVSFMKPLKAYYSHEIETWLANNPGRIVTHYQVAKLFKEAYSKAATMTVAENGFRHTGIMPYNPNIFTDLDFLTATDRNATREASMTTPLSTPLSISAEHSANETPSPSSSTMSHVSPTDIAPIPIIPDALPSTRRGSAKIISDSPHKNELLRSEEKKASAELKKKNAALKRSKKTKSKAATKLEKPSSKAAKKSKKPSTKSARQLKMSSTDAAEEIASTSAGASKLTSGKSTKGQKQMSAKEKTSGKTQKVRAGRKKKIEEFSSSDDSSQEEIEYDSSGESEESDEEDDAVCQFCFVRFTENRHGEDWIRCSKCWAWNHEECDAAVEECSDRRKYICSSCLNA